MRIKRIEIIGFKSFCDRAVVNITTPITSVVGPNGCGKSNIVDAIRWCMGEQSARHLRGKAMDDVIFAGSESRGPASMAEVSLTFDDVGFSHETVTLNLASEAPKSTAEDGSATAAETAPDGAETEPAEDADNANADNANADNGDNANGDAPVAETAAQAAAAATAASAAVGTGLGPVADSTGDSSAGDPSEGGVREDPAVEPQDAPGQDAPGQDAPGQDAPGAVADGDTEAAAAAAATAAAAAAEAQLDVDYSATKEADEVLQDRPPAFDFARYSEVTVTRRLFRDGTSQYMINKTPCRLRDVTEFFLGTGVGTKAYSIIEQGRVGMIVSSRPQERRAIIEEAAGITKFKTKKRAAERKLEQTRHNLLRVSDIVSELGKRMGSLRRQAQKAERYRRYKAEMRDIELWKAAHKYLEMRAEDKVLATTLVACRQELDTVRAEYDAKDGKLIAERAELAVEERRLASLQEDIYELENHIKLSESKIGFQTREATALDERATAAREEIRELVQRQQEGAAQLVGQRQELEMLNEQVAVEEEGVASREMAAAEARQMLANAQSQLDEARAQLSRAQADLVRAESQGEAVVRRRDETTRRLERVVGDTRVANERLSPLERQAKKLAGQLAELRQTRLDLGSQSESLAARRQHLEATRQQCEAEVETLRSELHRRKSRLQSLVEIQDKYEGFARGTRAVMQAAQERDSSFVDGRVRGLVADVVNAPERFEVAVEAALGDRLGGILVDAPEVGAEAVRYLKNTAAGRSAFVPFGAPTDGGTNGAGGDDRADAGAGSGPGLAMAIDHEGVVGRMVDLVGFDDGFAHLGSALIGDCLVVDGLERAVALHRQGLGHTLVTLDGDIVDVRGVVAGGSRESQGASVLAQKREIRELEAHTAKLDNDLATATARLVATRSEHQQVSKTLDTVRTESHEGDIAIMAHEKDLAQCRNDLDRVRERLTQLNAEQLELEEQLRGVADEEAELAQLRVAAGDRVERYEREQLGFIEGVTDGRARVEELTQLFTEARVRTAQLGEKRASLEAAVLRLEAAERELGQRIGKLDNDIAQGRERVASLRADSDSLQTQLTELSERRRHQAEAMEQGRSAYEHRVAELQVTEVAVRELRNRAESLTTQSSQLEVKLGNLRVNLQALTESIEDRYQLELSRNLTDYHLRPCVTEVEDKRLAELKRLIDRMGSDINLTAIDEYAEVSQRHDFLETQKSDLENAVEQLETAIAKINKTSRKLFRDTYAAVNKQFQEVFPRLFRGGQARLQLTGTKTATGEDVDLLDAGVEIIAQPPGKKNATVEQLSGGEKALTAVALIFSIFLIKPSPFCLLDEVDAPLDDANVDRYNEIVREMTDRSQFIVITHNKRTMEIADNLYGVTMQEPGVSKLVSVNLSKIDERAAA